MAISSVRPSTRSQAYAKSGFGFVQAETVIVAITYPISDSRRSNRAAAHAHAPSPHHTYHSATASPQRPVRKQHPFEEEHARAQARHAGTRFWEQPVNGRRLPDRP